MKFGSLKSSTSLDGELCIISRNLKMATNVSSICPSLREFVESWNKYEGQFQEIYKHLNSVADFKDFKFSNLHAFEVNEENFASCLPRTWLFADGSAFIQHIKLVRQARKAPLPETLKTVPLMYQAESGSFLDPRSSIPQIDFSHGTDFEAEVGVIVDNISSGTTAEEAEKRIKLICLINDISLRNLIPEELASGFGFFQSKPNKTLSPFAVTPDELATDWKNSRLHLPLNVNFKDNFFGKANAGQMHFNFGQLIAHAAKTRSLAAGSLIGSGTVSNEDESVGSSCLVEKRMIEQIKYEKISTEYMKVGDRVEIFMNDQSGQNIFGTIKQTVVKI